MLFKIQNFGALATPISPHPQFANANATSPQGEVMFDVPPPAHPREGGKPVQTSKMDTHLRGDERGILC